MKTRNKYNLSQLYNEKKLQNEGNTRNTIEEATLQNEGKNSVMELLWLGVTPTTDKAEFVCARADTSSTHTRTTLAVSRRNLSKLTS